MPDRRSVLSALLAGVPMVCLPSAASASDKIVASLALGPVVVPTNTTLSIPVTFAGIPEPITGIGLTGTFVTQQGDTQDGLGPWPIDVRLTANAPTGQSLAWNPIGGDVSIADFPFEDGTPGLPSVDGNGQWTFDFDSVEPVSNWIYRVDDAIVYLLADAPQLTITYTAEPDPAQQWDRPFFIAGVSGLGPVAYEAFEFTVDESGVYEFESILASGGDHFTFLYKDAFDPQAPLDNLLDYGLGNGNAVNDAPRGTSRISALLFSGVTYTWVTSQWSRFSGISQAANTIDGPGTITETNGCPADVNDNGELDPGDFTAWVAAYNAQDPAADQNADSVIDPSDFTAWVVNFNAGCD